MKITIEIENEAVASQVAKAIINEAYKWDCHSEYFREQHEKVQSDSTYSANRKLRYLEHFDLRCVECKTMSDELYGIAGHIKEECGIAE